jgi:hypothetical protein
MKISGFHELHTGEVIYFNIDKICAVKGYGKDSVIYTDVSTFRVVETPEQILQAIDYLLK